MEQTLPEEIIETIDYQPWSLTTTYSFAYPKEQLERFEQEFFTSYLARLLENAEATLTWENQQNNWLVLRINVHYEGAEENEPIDYWRRSYGCIYTSKISWKINSPTDYFTVATIAEGLLLTKENNQHLFY